MTTNPNAKRAATTAAASRNPAARLLARRRELDQARIAYRAALLEAKESMSYAEIADLLGLTRAGAQDAVRIASRG